MRLHESLQICLLALAHRRPNHVIDINEAILGPQPYGAEGWCATDIIEMFELTSPKLLQTPACLILDGQETVIYLMDHSEEMAAFSIHCQGKIPPCQGNMRMREQALFCLIG